MVFQDLENDPGEKNYRVYDMYRYWDIIIRESESIIR
jgi:hypothetical protein